MVMEDEQHVLSVLRELRALGVRIDLDYFGSGFSALNYVKDLPVDALKIDKSFIAGLEGRRGERRYRAPDRRLRIHAGSQGHRRGSGERPAGGEPHGHEVRSGPGFLFLETARQRGSSWRLTGP